MKNIKIIIIFVLLLFAVKQGALAQTKLDTLQGELNNIAAERIKLQRRTRELKMQQAELQRADHILTSLQSSGVTTMSIQDITLISRIQLPQENVFVAENRIRRNERLLVELNILRLELQRQEAEINGQIEVLKKRENAIKNKEAHK